MSLIALFIPLARLMLLLLMFIMSELEEEQKDMLRALCPDDPGQETEASLSDRFESFKERGRSFLQSVSRSLSIEVGVTDTG